MEGNDRDGPDTPEHIRFCTHENIVKGVCANCDMPAGDYIPPEDIDAVLNARGSIYGVFLDNAALSQSLKHCMAQTTVWRTDKLAADQREALELMSLKISRILTGDPDYLDNWIDIEGYAKLVSDRLKGNIR